MNRRQRWWLTVMGAIVLSGGMSLAVAQQRVVIGPINNDGQNGRWYVAAGCQESGRGESGDLLRNESLLERRGTAGSGRVICPALRGYEAGASELWFTFYATDTMAGSDSDVNSRVTCAASMRNRDGSPVTWVTLATVGSSPQAQEVFYSVTANFSGPWSVECQLPRPRSDGSFARLHTYFLDAIGDDVFVIGSVLP